MDVSQNTQRQMLPNSRRDVSENGRDPSHCGDLAVGNAARILKEAQGLPRRFGCVNLGYTTQGGVGGALEGCSDSL
jgi:hypothetical protein